LAPLQVTMHWVQ